LSTTLLNIDIGHSERILKALDDRDKAQFIFFRIIGPKLQDRLSSLLDLKNVPSVFIHGNPHIDNYAQTETGSGLVDFDRSRLGPYVWDIVRFISSLQLRSADQSDWIHKKVLNSFKDGYMATFENPDLYFSTPFFIQKWGIDKKEDGVRDYVDNDGKWIKRMRKKPLSVDDEGINKILYKFLESRNDTRLLDRFKLTEVGTSVGSLGKVHYIYLLEPMKGKSDRSPIILDIKECYTEEDDEWFKNPAEHHGLRMIRASNLYAPGIEQRLGHLTYKGKEMWGRQIPIHNRKIKHMLNLTEQVDLSYCIGTQLGRAHRRSCRDQKVSKIAKHFIKHEELIMKTSKAIYQEVQNAFEFFEKSKSIESELTGFIVNE